jgi:hypothetical protein
MPRIEVTTKEVLIPVREFAHAIYRSPSTVARYIRLGRLDYVQPFKGAIRMIPITELRKFGIRYHRCRGKGRKNGQAQG